MFSQCSKPSWGFLTFVLALGFRNHVQIVLFLLYSSILFEGHISHVLGASACSSPIKLILSQKGKKKSTEKTFMKTADFHVSFERSFLVFRFMLVFMCVQFHSINYSV